MKFEMRDQEPAKILGVCVLLAVMVAIVFGRTSHYDFVHYDDYDYVANNSLVTGGLSLSAFAWAFESKAGGLWTPLVTVSHMLDWQFYGSNAGGHHITNVLLHLGSAILLLLILQRMTGALWRSAFVAAVFAIHPLHVESVAWISERKDMLSGLFFMLTLGAYLLYIERPVSVGRYLAVFSLFALGLMCKPMLVTLPFVLLLLDYWPLKRLLHSSPAGGDSARWLSINRRAVAEKIPLLALSCVLCAMTVLGPIHETSSDLAAIPFWTRMGEAPASFVIYLGQMIWPAGLAVIYTHYEETLPWWPAALALLGSISVGAFFLRGRYPYLWMGWLWNLVMLAPVSGIVQISRHTRADHYNYLPQIGLVIGLTWTVADWAAAWRHRRAVLGGAAAAVLFALLIAATRQTSYWRDDITLWTHALDCTRDNYAAHNQLGNALVLQGRIEQGIAQFRAALRINPAFATAHYSLGAALVGQGRIAEGIAEYREALRTDPARATIHSNLGLALLAEGHGDEGISEFREALRLNPNLATAHDNLGVALFRQGKTEDGIAEFREALRINPSLAEAHFDLGSALLARGQTEQGIAEIRKALRLDPTDERAHFSLGAALLGQGQFDDGIAELREASKIKPSDPHVHNTLGIALFRQGKPEEGITEFRESVKVDPNDAQAHNNLAKALLEQGLTRDAIAEARKALDLQPANGTFQNNLAWMLATAPDLSLRDGAMAVQLALQARQSSSGNDPNILRTLAAAYAQSGIYNNALQIAQTALRASQNGALADELRRDIHLYETNHPLPDGQ